MQLSMTAFLAGLVIGQLVIGPLSDGLGRRRLLAPAPRCSPCCPWRAPRRLHRTLRHRPLPAGVAGAAGTVLARAVLTDRFSGPGCPATSPCWPWSWASRRSPPGGRRRRAVGRLVAGGLRGARRARVLLLVGVLVWVPESLPPGGAGPAGSAARSGPWGGCWATARSWVRPHAGVQRRGAVRLHRRFQLRLPGRLRRLDDLLQPDLRDQRHRHGLRERLRRPLPAAEPEHPADRRRRHGRRGRAVPGRPDRGQRRQPGRHLACLFVTAVGIGGVFPPPPASARRWAATPPAPPPRSWAAASSCSGPSRRRWPGRSATTAPGPWRSSSWSVRSAPRWPWSASRARGRGTGVRPGARDGAAAVATGTAVRAGSASEAEEARRCPDRRQPRPVLRDDGRSTEGDAGDDGESRTRTPNRWGEGARLRDDILAAAAAGRVRARGVAFAARGGAEVGIARPASTCTSRTAASWWPR
ncbi:hypothetical protein NKH77_09270 [Streptomyces sp. M19]